jgi:hypothetical protein
MLFVLIWVLFTTGCGTVFLVLVGTLLGSPPATSSLRERRPNDFHLKKIKTTKRTTTPAYPGLRAVHTPAVTPVVGSRRMTVAARGGTHACLEKASDESMHTLQEMPLIGQHAVGIPGEHRQVPMGDMGLLAGAVGLVLVGKIVHKVNYATPIVVSNMNVLSHILILDTSILATNNMHRREYIKP